MGHGLKMIERHDYFTNEYINKSMASQWFENLLGEPTHSVAFGRHELFFF